MFNISYNTSWPYYWNRHYKDRAHSRDNVPYNLAKHIIVFVSNEEKSEYGLNELKNWLKSCKYSENLINKAFGNARLKGPAPLKQILI